VVGVVSTAVSVGVGEEDFSVHSALPDPSLVKVKVRKNRNPRCPQSNEPGLMMDSRR